MKWKGFIRGFFRLSSKERLRSNLGEMMGKYLPDSKVRMGGAVLNQTPQIK